MRYFNPCRDSILTTLVDSVSDRRLPFRLFVCSSQVTLLLSPFVPLRRVMQLRLLFEWTIKRPRGAPPIIQFLFNRLLYSYTRASSRDPFSLENHPEREEKKERKKQRGSVPKDKERVGNAHSFGRGRGTMVRTRDYCRFPDWQSNYAGILLIFCCWQGAYYEKRKLITATAPPLRRSATCIDGRASQTRPGLHRRPPRTLVPLTLAIDLCWWNRVRARV